MGKIRRTWKKKTMKRTFDLLITLHGGIRRHPQRANRELVTRISLYMNLLHKFKEPSVHRKQSKQLGKPTLETSWYGLEFWPSQAFTGLSNFSSVKWGQWYLPYRVLLRMYAKCFVLVDGTQFPTTVRRWFTNIRALTFKTIYWWFIGHDEVKDI